MFISAVIETERLLIRPYQQEDAESLYKMTQEPGHFNYMPEVPPANLQEIMNLITWSMNCNAKNTKEKIYKFNLSVFLRETGEFIGISGLGPNDLNPEEVELYYSLTQKHQGKGYAKEAAKAVLDYGFETIGLPKVVGIVHPKNSPSLNIIKVLGMKFVKEVSGQVESLKDHNSYHLYEIWKTN
ncbi:GNAT family N-acetyltransferase [Fredinandcohnia sp. 179-A 10B2 NHS]|uniref:GNAT family N-acetyltransferase n=1 Tax=Fredinandcohnia sp. 179-A 10B2 NHS TaxID=3235176 RepID=UPI0039A06DF8